MPESVVASNPLRPGDFSWPQRYATALVGTESPAYREVFTPRLRLKAPAVDYDICKALSDPSEVKVRVTGLALKLTKRNIPAAMVLSHIAYMYSKPTVFSGHRRTFLKSHGETPVIVDRASIATRLGLSVHQVKRALALLWDEKLIAKYRGDGRIPLATLTEPAQELVNCKFFGITLRKRVVDACEGNLVAALTLTNIAYWLGLSKKRNACRARYFSDDDRPWLAKSRTKLAGELGVSEDRARNSLDYLVCRGFLARQLRYGRFGSCMLYSIEPEAIANAVVAQPMTYWYGAGGRRY